MRLFTMTCTLFALALLLAGRVPARAATVADMLPADEQVLADPQLRMTPRDGDEAFFLEKFGKADLTGDVPPDLDETDLVSAIRRWPLLPESGQPDQAFFDEAVAGIKEFIHRHRETPFTTALLPPLIWDRDGDAANGIQPLLAPTLDEARLALTEKPALRVDEATFLADNEITEDEDSEGNPIYIFGRTDPGNWYRFDDVHLVFFFQKEANYPDRGETNRYPDMEGTLITDPATFEEDAFLEKYERLEAPVGDPDDPQGFHLTDPTVFTVVFSPEGDKSYDPGHEAYDPADLRFEQEKMQVYVHVTGRIMKAPAGGSTPSASSFSEVGSLDIIGEQKYYVEDYYPPIPTSPDQISAALQTEEMPGTPSSADLDLPAVNGWDQAAQKTVVRRGFPDPTLGEGLLASLELQDDNPNDVNSTATFNFEIGRSIRHRFRYSATGAKVPPGGDPSVLDRYIIYVPPYRGDDGSGGTVTVGPYVGRIDPSFDNPDDPYDGPNWLPRYSPIGFKGNLLEAVNHLYENPPNTIQAEFGQTDRGTGQYGYPYTAKVIYKFGAECVVGINATGGNLQLPPYIMLMPAGFASYTEEGKVGSPDAVTTQEPLTSTSDSGGPMDGTEARDSFFKVNVADCCGNDKVLVSGTYAIWDNIRPNIRMGLEERVTAPGRSERVRYVAGVPNEASAGSNDTPYEYNINSPISRVDVGIAPEQRLYGNHINQAPVWSSREPPGSLANPNDSRGVSFLDITGGGTKPPIVEDHAMNLLICAEDNLGEVEKSGPSGRRLVYPISRLSFHVVHPDGSRDEEVVLVDENNNDQDQPVAPCFSHPYIFRTSGTHRVVVTARDLSGNQRVMEVEVPVEEESMEFQEMMRQQQRGEY